MWIDIGAGRRPTVASVRRRTSRGSRWTLTSTPGSTTAARPRSTCGSTRTPLRPPTASWVTAAGCGRRSDARGLGCCQCCADACQRTPGAHPTAW